MQPKRTIFSILLCFWCLHSIHCTSFREPKNIIPAENNNTLNLAPLEAEILGNLEVEYGARWKHLN